MPQIVVATQDEGFREELSAAMLEGGHAVGFASSWARVVESVAQPGTRLLLIDAASPAVCQGLERAAMLADLARSMPSAPALRSVRGGLPPLEELPIFQAPRMAARLAGPAVPREELRLLTLLGVGRNPLQVLAKLARTTLPVVLMGERGSGKQRVASAVHALGGGGAFVVVKGPQGVSPAASPGLGAGAPSGTLYLPLQAGMPLDRALDIAREGREAGWRVVIGTREPLPSGVGEWASLALNPLRERPRDLHALALLYLDRQRKAMGLPRRRLAKATWALVETYTWPGNARELESFVVSMLSSAPRALIHPRHLSPAARAMISPSQDAAAVGAAAVFEDLVESPIRRVVELFEPGGDLTLNRLVLDGVERPLLRAVLARTGGNRKAAATLLGVSRNTFKEHVERLLGGK
ncbi:MAG: helix-turn-helix domain-containing protein [Pseudomonadota bacterium]